MSCSGEGCDSQYIQNKKYNLCSDCVFKKSHNGKSKQEVYMERKKYKLKDVTYKIVKQGLSPNIFQDEESLKNEQNQNSALCRAIQDSDFKNKKPKQLKKASSEQLEINRKYKLTCIDMDYTAEPICTGCGQYQGGNVRLSHSHIISRKECKEIGRPELIYERNNLTFHCMDFAEKIGCHLIHENETRRKELLDYEANKAYVKSISMELYRKYLIYE